MSDPGICAMPTGIHGIIREYMDPHELELASDAIPTLTAVEYAANENWSYGMDRALTVQQYCMRSIMLASGHDDIAMSLVLFTHRHKWMYFANHCMHRIVSTLTAYGHHLNQRDTGLSADDFNLDMFDGACRVGNCTLMRKLKPLIISPVEAIKYNQFKALKLLVEWGVNKQEAYEAVVMYGRVKMFRWFRAIWPAADIDSENLQLIAIHYNQLTMLFMIRKCWPEISMHSESGIIRTAIRNKHEAMIIGIWNQSSDFMRDFMRQLLSYYNHDLQFRLF